MNSERLGRRDVVSAKIKESPNELQLTDYQWEAIFAGYCC